MIIGLQDNIYCLELGSIGNFIYLIHDKCSNRTAVVDPAWDVSSIIALSELHSLEITDVLLTHSHYDHINGVAALLDYSDAELHLLKAEAEFWDRHPYLPTLHEGGDFIKLGKTNIEILHTPGHTPGSACYRLGNKLLTGDTLFVFGCGRCDLQGGDPEKMYYTLRRLCEHLPGETVIMPGHNYGITPTSTMTEQIAGNPFLHFNHRQDFVEYRMRLKDRKEPYEPETGT